MATENPHPYASLIIPCYNEAANLPLLIDCCRQSLAGASLEVVLVDNGSTDNSPVILAEHLAEDSVVRSVRVEVNQGYGFGILSGLREARGEILGWTHADMQTHPADTLKAIEFFKQSSKPEKLLAKGTRYGRPAADFVFTMGMSAFETILLGYRLWDINAQPTLFHREFFETWSDPPSDFSLDLFAYYQACAAGITVERFPVSFGERAHGSSHWNVDWSSKVKFIRRTMGFSFELRRRIRQ